MAAELPSPVSRTATENLRHERRRHRPDDHSPPPTDDFEPAWSPDGTKIAFASNRDGNHEIYVMNADGTEPDEAHQHPRIRLRTDVVARRHEDRLHQSAEWRQPGDLNPEIYIMNSDGAGLRRVTVNPGFTDADPPGRRADPALRSRTTTTKRGQQHLHDQTRWHRASQADERPGVRRHARLGPHDPSRSEALAG